MISLVLAGLLSERDRACEVLGLSPSPLECKEAFIKATQNLIPPVEVNEAPCKERVYTSNFDATVPWKYKSLKGGRDFPLFARAKFQVVDLQDYLQANDFSR